VLLAHGGGGRLAAELVARVFLPHLDDPELRRLADAAVLDAEEGRLALSTDGYVVRPRFFPGGDIGSLAVHGTVNDLAMMGARPRAITAAFVVEEGLPVAELERIAASMGAAARRAGVRVVAADTKVVERGGADGVFVTTAGVGVVPPGREVGPERIRPGDALVLTGPVGSHGVAVLSARGDLGFEVDVESDSAPLDGLVEAMLAAGDVRAMRDATRGGLAAVANELAGASGVRFVLDEAAIPVLDAVRRTCDALGLDPLHLANEGVCLAAVAPADVDAVLAAARGHEHGHHAAVIGEVDADDGAAGSVARVVQRTRYGIRRPLLVPAGDPLPRIC
jgi:hydrogenase expression/formation protein HypE